MNENNRALRAPASRATAIFRRRIHPLEGGAREADGGIKRLQATGTGEGVTAPLQNTAARGPARVETTAQTTIRSGSVFRSELVGSRWISQEHPECMRKRLRYALRIAEARLTIPNRLFCTAVMRRGSRFIRLHVARGETPGRRYDKSGCGKKPKEQYSIKTALVIHGVQSFVGRTTHFTELFRHSFLAYLCRWLPVEDNFRYDAPGV